MTETATTKPPQYTVTFLAGSFALTAEEAKLILAQSGGDRTKAARARGFKGVLAASCKLGLVDQFTCQQSGLNAYQGRLQR